MADAVGASAGVGVILATEGGSAAAGEATTTDREAAAISGMTIPRTAPLRVRRMSTSRPGRFVPWSDDDGAGRREHP
jgi:hypothetical protein